MPFSSGTFTLAAGNPVTTLTTISSTWANTTLSDVATGLSTAVLKDGTQTITANLPMSSFKLTGLGAGAAAGDSLRYEQVFTTATGSLALLGSLSVSSGLFVSGVVSASGAINMVQAALLTATSTVAIGAATGNYAFVTGLATVSGFDSIRAGALRIIEWTGATPLNNSASFILPGNADFTTSTGDLSMAVSDGAGTWRLMHHKRSGAPIRMSPIANSLTGDVALNNTGAYFDGPTVAQGTAGVWFVSGTVTVQDTAGAAAFTAKLWDGTTVIATLRGDSAAANQCVSIPLSGFITAPAGNLRISVKDATSTSGSIKFNISGIANDATITAIRIA